MSDTWRGHKILYGRTEWFYETDGVPVDVDPHRACGHCGRENTPEGHDGCLGTLPGVMNACCGHGESGSAYVQFEDGQLIRGTEAEMFFLTGCRDVIG